MLNMVHRQHGLPADLQRNQRLGGRHPQHVASGLRIAKDIELGGRRHVAAAIDGSAQANEPFEQAEEIGAAFASPLDVGERPQRQQRDFIGGHADKFSQHAARIADVVQIGHFNLQVAEAVGTVDSRDQLAHRIERRDFHRNIRCEPAQAGPLGRIEVLDDGMDVARGRAARHAAGRRGQANQVDLRIEQRHSDRQGVTNTGIGVDNQLVRQTGSFLRRKPQGSVTRMCTLRAGVALSSFRRPASMARKVLSEMASGTSVPPKLRRY